MGLYWGSPLRSPIPGPRSDRVANGRAQRGPEKCFRTYLRSSGTPLGRGIAHSFLRLLAREVPTVVDEFLDVIGIESQRASTSSHFHSRKIGLAFPRCMLNHPGDAHSQLLSDIPRPHELPNRPEFSGCADSARVEIHTIDSDITRSFNNALHDPYLRQRRDWGEKSPRDRLLRWEHNCDGLWSSITALKRAGLLGLALCWRVFTAGNLCVERSHSNT